MFNKFNFFFGLHFYVMFTDICENSQVVSPDFPGMKDIVVPLSCPSSFRIKLIFCFKSGSSNLICLLKSIAINL